MNIENLIGKTKREVLAVTEKEKPVDYHSSEWILYVERNFLGKRKYVILFFEKEIVIGVCTVFKNFWQKSLKLCF